MAVGGFEDPTAIVEVVNKMVAVTFLDELLRMNLTLKFQEKEPGRLLLSMATKRRYHTATDEMITRLRAGRADPKHQWGQFLAEIDQVIEGTTLILKPEGPTIRQYEHFSTPYAYAETVFQSRLADQWEPYPEFGYYGHLLKQDRGLSWESGLAET